MSILVNAAGILDTVQDLGRTGARRLGINPNGAMDARAARLVNLLLGNPENAGVLEMHFPAPALFFEQNAIIAVGGADFGAQLGERKIENWRTTFVEKNQILRFRQPNFGARAYLAVKGGFQIESWLGSQSTNLTAQTGGFAGRALRKGDRVFFGAQTVYEKPRIARRIAAELLLVYNRFPTVRVAPSLEFENLTEESQSVFQTQSFTVRAESNRMGYRLRGARLESKNKIEAVSAAVAFGTIQLLPDGQLVILMADHQTIGGYPRLGTVASVDLPLLAQLAANDRIRFKMILHGEAEGLYLQAQTKLNWLRAASCFL